MKKIYLLLLLGLIFFESRAQIPFNTASSSYTYSKPSLPPRGVYFGIGARIGDPLGITAKSYTQNQTALEFSLGQPSRIWYNNNYYEDRFFDKGGYDKTKQNFHKLDWRLSYAIALQVHHLWHQEIRQLPGLDWYWGVGGQIRVKSYKYEYSYTETSTGTLIEDEDRLTDVDLGPDGVIGLEYTFDELPLTVFLDATLFLEFIDNLKIYGQPGVGVRYHF